MQHLDGPPMRVAFMRKEWVSPEDMESAVGRMCVNFKDLQEQIEVGLKQRRVAVMLLIEEEEV